MTSVLELRHLICALEMKNMHNVLRMISEELINHWIVNGDGYRYCMSESVIYLSEKYLWHIPDFLKKLEIWVSEISLRDINFNEKSIFGQINLTRNKLSNIKITGVCFFNKCLQFNVLKNISFTGCNFIECSFAKDSFYNVKFIDCNFEKISIKGVSMLNTEFIECHFNQTEFEECHLNDIVMKCCVCFGFYTPEEGYLQYGLIICNSYLSDTVFEGCSFDELNFCQTILDNSMFSESKITNSFMGTSVFRDSSIEKCNILKVDFSETLFQDFFFLKTDFERSLFHNAHIKETVFEDCKLHYLHFCTVDNGSGYKSLIECVSFLKCMIEENIIFNANTQLIHYHFYGCNFDASHFSTHPLALNFNDI